MEEEGEEAREKGTEKKGLRKGTAWSTENVSRPQAEDRTAGLLSLDLSALPGPRLSWEPRAPEGLKVRHLCVLRLRFLLSLFSSLTNKAFPLNCVGYTLILERVRFPGPAWEVWEGGGGEGTGTQQVRSPALYPTMLSLFTSFISCSPHNYSLR